MSGISCRAKVAFISLFTALLLCLIKVSLLDSLNIIYYDKIVLLVDFAKICMCRPLAMDGLELDMASTALSGHRACSAGMFRNCLLHYQCHCLFPAKILLLSLVACISLYFDDRHESLLGFLFSWLAELQSLNLLVLALGVPIIHLECSNTDKVP